MAAAKYPVFIINLERRPERLHVIQKRMAKLDGFFNPPVIVSAVDAQDADEPLLSSVCAKNRKKRRGQLACYYSHLRAMEKAKSMASETDNWIFIVEDDACFHKEFTLKIDSILQNVPVTTPLILLSPFVTSWKGVSWAGKHPRCRNLATFTPSVYSTMCYMVRRDYIDTLLSLYNYSCAELAEKYGAQFERFWSPEIILQRSASDGGLFATPGVVMDPCEFESDIHVSSTARDFHVNYYKNRYDVKDFDI